MIAEVIEEVIGAEIEADSVNVEEDFLPADSGVAAAMLKGVALAGEVGPRVVAAVVLQAALVVAAATQVNS